MNQIYVAVKAPKFSEAIRKKLDVLEKCTSFLDGTVMAPERPGLRMGESSDGHKSKNSLKVLTLRNSVGLPLHTAGMLERKRNEWALYVQKQTEEQLDYFCTDGGSNTISTKVKDITGRR